MCKALVLLVGSIATFSGCNNPSAVSSYPSVPDSVIEAKLSTRIDVDYRATPLVDVFASLRDRLDVNLHAKWTNILRTGIEKDSPITMQLKGIPAATVIRMVTEQASEEAELEPIGFTIRDGILLVSTQRDIDRFTVTKVYDVEDLLVKDANFPDAPDFDINAALG